MMKEKAIIVTGGERGIGRAIVEDLLKRGARVCIAGIDTDAGRECLDELKAGNRLIFIETDVGREAAVRQMVEEVRQTFGGIDGFVANAGIADEGGTPITELSLEEWDRMIRTNLTGCFLCAKYAFPELRKTRGSMVLIASIRAQQSDPDTEAYSASKGGIVALGHALAISGGPEIRVNCISPGWIHKGDPAELRAIDHAQHPVGRVGKGSDVASLAAYLISEEAAFITGQNFIVDGGMTRKLGYLD